MLRAVTPVAASAATDVAVRIAGPVPTDLAPVAELVARVAALRGVDPHDPIALRRAELRALAAGNGVSLGELLERLAGAGLLTVQP